MDIYGYFVITDNFETCPAWVQSENYFNCENFSQKISYSQWTVLNSLYCT